MGYVGLGVWKFDKRKRRKYLQSSFQ